MKKLNQTAIFSIKHIIKYLSIKLKMENQIQIKSLDLPLTFYRSKKNGITLYYINTKGPLVYGYIVFYYFILGVFN